MDIDLQETKTGRIWRHESHCANRETYLAKLVYDTEVQLFAAALNGRQPTLLFQLSPKRPIFQPESRLEGKLLGEFIIGPVRRRAYRPSLWLPACVFIVMAGRRDG